jgi:predicted dehydrogenase
MTPGAQKQLFHDTVSDHGTETRVLWQGDEDWELVHRGLVADFAAAISAAPNGRPQPLTSLEQALVIQQLTDAIYQAATCGECVEVK